MIVFDQREIVKKYLGIPYKHMGRSMDGLDCWGLILNVYKDIGIKLFDLQEYEQEWARRGKNLILNNYYENWQKVNCPRTGDVVLFKYPKDIVSHAGLILTHGRFIHATQSGVVIARLHNWYSKVYGYYRWLNLKTN